METRVTYRTTPETVKRLQSLAEKYGVSQSALLTMLVNERFLSERLRGDNPRTADEAPRITNEPEPSQAFSEYVHQAPSKKRRKRSK